MANKMYTDVEFTKKYLDILAQFSSFLVHYSNELPQSQKSQLSTFLYQLQNASRLSLKQLTKNKSLNTTIEINPNIIFPYKNPVGQKRKFFVSLGGKIDIQNGVISDQSLCLNLMLEHTPDCQNVPYDWKFYDIEQGFHIIRRFHFDYDSLNDDQVKPKFHLQYGGKFNNEYFDLSNVHYKLFQPIDHPRLPQQPHDLIMLLDFVLREFSLKGQEITREKRWNEFVIQSEKLWLTPYYENLITKLQCGSRNTPLHRTK